MFTAAILDCEIRAGSALQLSELEIWVEGAFQLQILILKLNFLASQFKWKAVQERPDKLGTAEAPES